MLFIQFQTDLQNSYILFFTFQDGIGSSESLQNAEKLAGIVGKSMKSSNNGFFMFLGQNIGR